jgi:hypothetical protein
MPEGGTSGYTPDTNGTIRIELSPSLQFLDTHNSYLSFRIKAKDGTVDLSKECRMDKNSMSWCRSFTIYSSTGSTIEHIDHYNLLTCLTHKTTSPQDYRTSIGQMVDNSGDRAVRNAAMAAPAGKVYNSGFDMSGVLNGGNDDGRLLPLGFMQGPLVLEMVLAPFNECFVGTSASGETASYQIDNCEYHCQCLSFSPEYNAKFAQQLRTRGIDMSFSTYKTHNTVLTSNSVDMAISQNSASVKGVYHILRSKDKYQSPEYDSLSEYKSGNVREVQWDMGSKLFPEYPMKLDNDGVVDLYSHNLTSYNMFRNHALGSSVDDTNFWTTEASSFAKGYTSGSGAHKATPVRRVYGTWVANGTEVYGGGLDQEVKITAAEFAVGAGGGDVVKFIAGDFVQQVIADGATYNGRVVHNKDGNGAGRATLLRFTHWVTTLHFVPHNARDIPLVQTGMRCKIGSAEFPSDETSNANNIDITHQDGTSGQFINLNSDINAIDTTVANRSVVIQNANGMEGGAEKFQGLGLDRFFQDGPDKGTVKYYKTNPKATAGDLPGTLLSDEKNNNYAHDAKNVMYPGQPCAVAWGHPGVAGSANAGNPEWMTGIPARFVSGIGIPFTDGLNRPIISTQSSQCFEGWVEILPDDSSFFLGCNFETHPESQHLVSGSDLTSSTPLHLRVEYDSAANSASNFYEMKNNNDPFTSFVHIDAVLRLQEDGTVVSSV